PPNGRQRSDATPPASMDCSCLCGCDPVTWRGYSDRSSISTLWIRKKRLHVPPCSRVSNTSDANPPALLSFPPRTMHLTYRSVPPFQEPCYPYGTSPIRAIPISPDAKSYCAAWQPRCEQERRWASPNHR